MRKNIVMTLTAGCFLFGGFAEEAKVSSNLVELEQSMSSSEPKKLTDHNLIEKISNLNKELKKKLVLSKKIGIRLRKAQFRFQISGNQVKADQDKKKVYEEKIKQTSESIENLKKKMTEVEVIQNPEMKSQKEEELKVFNKEMKSVVKKSKRLENSAKKNMERFQNNSYQWSKNKENIELVNNEKIRLQNEISEAEKKLTEIKGQNNKATDAKVIQ